MEHIREYLLSVTAAALLCGIIQSLAGEKSGSAGILRLVCGIFLSLTVIRPVSEIHLDELSLFPSDIIQDAEFAAEEGADYAKQAMARLIKEEAEAYILSKAQALRADLSVKIIVSTDDPPIPIAVTLTGNVSPSIRKQLGMMMESDLGIPKEDQKWISNSNS